MCLWTRVVRTIDQRGVRCRQVRAGIALVSTSVIRNLGAWSGSPTTGRPVRSELLGWVRVGGHQLHQDLFCGWSDDPGSSDQAHPRAFGRRAESLSTFVPGSAIRASRRYCGPPWRETTVATCLRPRRRVFVAYRAPVSPPSAPSTSRRAIVRDLIPNRATRSGWWRFRSRASSCPPNRPVCGPAGGHPLSAVAAVAASVHLVLVADR
jgi:hypothetical protein